MKPFLAALSILLVLCLSVQAEGKIPGISGKGIKLGLGFSTLSTSIDEFEGYDSYAGPVIGVFLTYNLTPEVALQPELIYVEKGAGGGILGGRRWRHNYLEVPVVLKYCLSVNGKLKPSVYLGPAMSILMSADFRGSVISDVIDTKNAMKGFDVGIAIGGAVDYRHLVFDIRYTVGMVNAYDPAEWNRLLEAEDPADIYHMITDDYMKNRCLAFTLGYRF